MPEGQKRVSDYPGAGVTGGFCKLPNLYKTSIHSPVPGKQFLKGCVNKACWLTLVITKTQEIETGSLTMATSWPELQ